MFPSARFPALKRIPFRGGRDRREGLPSLRAGVAANYFRLAMCWTKCVRNSAGYRGHAVQLRFAPSPTRPGHCGRPHVETEKERLGAFDWRHYGAEPIAIAPLASRSTDHNRFQRGKWQPASGEEYSNTNTAACVERDFRRALVGGGLRGIFGIFRPDYCWCRAAILHPRALVLGYMLVDGLLPSIPASRLPERRALGPALPEGVVASPPARGWLSVACHHLRGLVLLIAIWRSSPRAYAGLPSTNIDHGRWWSAQRIA